MRRGILIGLAIGALLFAGIVGAKVVNVTNPMSADLNANGFQIMNASNIDAQGGIAGGGFCNWVDFPNNCITWLAGTADPRGQFQASAGSFYTRRVGATYPGTSGEFWFKTGPTAADWSCVAGCSP